MATNKRKLNRMAQVAETVRRQVQTPQQTGAQQPAAQQGALGTLKQQALNTFAQRSAYPMRQPAAAPAPATGMGAAVSAMTNKANKAGGATQPAGFDMEAYKRIVNDMLGNAASGYTREQEALMAATPGAVVQPMSKVAPHLYEQQAAWEAGGGVKPPMVYDDYMHKLAMMQGGDAAYNMGIYDARVAGGARPYTQEELDAIADPNRAVAFAEGQEPSAWDVWWNVGGARDAINAAYAGQVNDMQYAMMSGAWDNPESLVNGNMAYVSTEYLNMMLEELPGMMAQQAAEHQGLIDRGFVDYVEGQRILGNPALYDYVNTYYDPASQTPVEDFLDEFGDESAMGHMGTLIELDNKLYGTAMTVEEFAAMPPQQQAEAFNRMMNNYASIIMGDEGAYSVMQEYPYDALMESIEAELESRDILAGYMDVVVANPNAWAFMGPDMNTVAHMTNADIGSPYYAVYYRNDEDTSWGMAPLSMMTEIEEAVFYYLANTEGTDQGSARAYLDALAPVLQVRARNADKLAWGYAATADWVGAVGSWVAARGANLANPVLAGAEMLGEMITGEQAAVPNVLHDFNQTVTSSQQAALGELGGPTFLGQNWQQWAYGAGTNVVDMGLAMAVGGKIAPMLGMTPNAAALLLMSGEAAASEWGELAGQDMATWEKVARAIGTGAIEALTEKLPLDAITGKLGKGWRRVLMSAGSEGVEEMVSELSGYGLDATLSWIAGHPNEIQTRMSELEQMGVQNPEEVVLGEVITGTLQAGVGGTLAGFAMGGTADATDYVRDYSLGRTINTNNPSGVNAMLEFAGTMAEGTESRRLAETLKGKAEGGKVSSRKVGELFRALAAETPGKYRAEIEEMSVPAVVEALEDTYASLGLQMEDRYSPEEIARAILSAEGNANALKKTAIGKFIITHRGTKQVAEEFAKANAAWSKQLQERRTAKNLESVAAMSTLMNMTSKPDAEQMDAAPTAEAVTETIQDKDVEAITGRMTPHAGIPRAVVMTAEDGSSTQGSLVRVERSGDALSLVVSQEGQEGETTVTLGEGVNVPDSGIAQVLAYAQQRRWISAGEINDMVNLALETQLPAASVIAAYEAGVNAGFIGAEMPKAETIAAKLGKAQADKVAEVISMGMAVGASTAQNAEDVRKAAAEKRSAMMQRGAGSVTYMGKVSSMREAATSKVRQKVKGIRGRLTAEQNAAVDALGQMSQVLGVNIVLYESTGEAGQINTMANGWFDQATRDIYIDLNSGMTTFGQEAVKFTILKTAAHELTHYIESSSAQGYAQLRAAVREQLEERGENYMTLILDKVKDSGTLKDRVAAETEVIADACEMMLTNTRAITELANRNKGLAARVAQFIGRFRARVARAMAGLTATSREAVQLVNAGVKYVDGLQQAWDRALIEAANAEAVKPRVTSSTRVGAMRGEGGIRETAQPATDTEAVTVEETVADVAADEEAGTEGEAPEQIAPTTGTAKVVPAAVDMDTISAEVEAIEEEFDGNEQGIAAIALTQVASRLHALNEAQLEGVVTDAVSAAADVFQVTEPTEAVRAAVLNHIRSIQANARAATTQDMQTTMEAKKPAMVEAVASEAGAEALQTVETSGVTEIPAEAVAPIVADMAEAAVEAGIQAAEAAAEAAETAEILEAGAQDTEQSILPAMTEAAQNVATEAYVGTNEETRAVLAQVAEGVARAAEERVSWEVAVSEARGRQADAEGHEIPVEDVPTTLQFQMRTSIEKRNDGLMAVHNLKGQELLKTLRLGGFPMPSIAVIKAATGHNDYGDVSIVFGRDTVDPRVDPANRIYGADAWTPTFPRIDTELDMDALYDMRRVIAEAVSGRDAYLSQQTMGYFNQFVGNEWTSESRERLLDRAWNNEGLLAAYMMEKGRAFDIAQMHEAIERGYKPEFADMYDVILDALSGEDTTGLKLRELVETYGERLAAQSNELNRLVTWANNGDRRAAISIANRIREARAYESAGRDSTIQTRLVNDYVATRKALQKAIERADFEGWMTGKLNGFMGQEGVSKGVDPYKRDGSIKSFRQTHMAVTAENIVKAMKTQEENSSDATTAKGLMAATAKRYGSIEEIRGDAYRLGEIGEEEYKALIAQADELLEKFMAAVGARDYFKQEEAGYLLVEAAKKKLDAASIAKLFKKNGFPVADLAAGRMAETIIKSVQEMPTGYFEAKPYRVVGFDEVRMVVAPQSMPSELAAELNRRGIPYTTYDGTAEDRMAKMNAVEGVKFSERNVHVLTPSEYRRLQSEWMNYKYRGYQYTKRANGGIVVDFDNLIVYTDRRGQPEYVLDVRTDERWTNNDVYNLVVEMETEGITHEMQRIILESCFGTEGARFRTGKKRDRIAGEKGNGAGRNAGGMGKRNNGDVSGEEEDGNVTQFSERRATAPSLRETLLAMEETSDMTATEKELLAKYKKLVADYRELESQVEAQRTLAEAAEREYETLKTTPARDEYLAQNNRLGVLQSKLRRASDALYHAEKRTGFADLMNRYRMMVQAFNAGSTRTQAAERLQARLEEITRMLKDAQQTGDIMDEEALEEELTHLMDVKKLRELARELKKTHHTTLREKDIRRRIAYLLAMQLNEEKEKAPAAVEDQSGRVRVNEVTPFLRGLQQLVRDLNELERIRDDATLDIFRDHVPGVVLSESDAEEIRQAVGMQEFRRVMRAAGVNVTVDKTGTAKTTADDALRQMPEGYYNSNFADINNPIDQWLKAYEIIKAAAGETADDYFQQTGEEYLAGEMEELMVRIESVSLKPGQEATIRKIINTLRNRKPGEAITMDRLDLAARQIAQAKMDVYYTNKAAMKKAKEAAAYYRKLETQRRLTAEREDLQKMNDLLKGKVKDWFAERELMEERRKLMDGIRMQVHWMDIRIRRETDQRRIPEGLKPVVEEAVRIFGAANAQLKVFSAKELDGILRTYEKLKDVHGTDLHRMDDIVQDNLEDALANLRAMTEKFSKTAEVEDRMERIRQRVAVMQEISDVISMIRNAIEKADVVVIEGQERSLEDVTQRLSADLGSRQDYSINARVGKVWEQVKEHARNGNLTPPMFFRLIGSSVLTELNDSLMSAQGKHARLFKAAQERIAEIKKAHNYYAWQNNAELEMTTWQGGDKHLIQLTPEEALSIWVTWKREHSDSDVLVHSHHLEEGGFNLARKERKVGKRIVYDGTPHKLSQRDFATIDAWLTDEMKAYAEDIVQYLSTDMAELGNETSMQLFGIKKFTESYYFPMKVKPEQLEVSSSKGAKDPGESNRVAHFGGTKRRVDQAKKALVIGGITEVASQHINEMLLYNTFAIPIESFNKVLNQTYFEGEPLTDEERKAGNEPDPASRMTLRGLFKQKMGDDLAKYMQTYIADLNGGLSQDGRDKGLAGQFLSLYKRSAVMASLSVAIQQPSAIVRAMYLVDWKYFVPLLQNKDGVNTNITKEWAQLTKYSNTALVKERGGFDMTSGRGLTEQLIGSEGDDFNFMQRQLAKVGVGFQGGAKQRAQGAARAWENAAGFLPGFMDQVTWTMMWRVVKAEVADQNRSLDKNSEAFLKLAAKRFDEVMNLTQVYDSTLVRSHNMRSKSMGMKMLTAFMGESTVTANMLLDAAATKKPKMIARAAVVFFAQAVFNAALKALWTAFRDDDEEKAWVEKYLGAIGNQLGGYSGALNPAALIPGLKDLMALADGYDVERADMAVWSDLITEFRRLNSGYYDNRPAADMVQNIGGAVANLFGIPMKNVMRDVRTGVNALEQIFGSNRETTWLGLAHDASYNFVLARDRDNEYYYNRLYEGLAAGDKQDVEEVRGFLAVLGRSATTIDTGIRGVVKDKYLAGELTEEEAMAFLVKHGLADDDKDAYKYVDKWREAPAHEGEDGYTYSQYNNLYEAIEAGDMPGINAAVKDLKEHGFLEDKGTLKSTLRARYRDQYRSLNKTNKTQFANLQAALVAALVAAGVPRSEALEYVKGWLKDTEKDKETGK